MTRSFIDDVALNAMARYQRTSGYVFSEEDIDYVLLRARKNFEKASGRNNGATPIECRLCPEVDKSQVTTNGVIDAVTSAITERTREWYYAKRQEQGKKE